MSVIFGIVDSKKIYIAGDKCTSTKEGKIISNNEAKVFEINHSLAFATAGSVAIGNAILLDVEHSFIGRESMRVEDLSGIIENFYQRAVDNNTLSIRRLPFNGLIAGLGKDGNSCLVSVGNFSEGYKAMEVPVALYAPADVDKNKCNQIFAENYKMYYDEFCEKTIRDIATISKIVSPAGIKWEYDLKSQYGTLIEINL